ncbi:MAG: hypothetical protein ACI4WS_13760 [Oscillospiraceae bacterium]
MSLKSFDKFCEKMILGEPGSEKEIYDERQKQIRTHLTVEALTVFSALSMIAVAINETGFQWCEGCFPVMVLCAALSYGWWVIRNAVKGSLFGFSGKGVKYTAILMLIYSPIYEILLLPNDLEKLTFIENGKLTTKAVVTISLLLMVVFAIITLVLYSRKKRSEADE